MGAVDSGLQNLELARLKVIARASGGAAKMGTVAGVLRAAREVVTQHHVGDRGPAGSLDSQAIAVQRLEEALRRYDEPL